jgi:glutamine cyclotransferase
MAPTAVAPAPTSAPAVPTGELAAPTSEPATSADYPAPSSPAAYPAPDAATAYLAPGTTAAPAGDTTPTAAATQLTPPVGTPAAPPAGALSCLPPDYPPVAASPAAPPATAPISRTAQAPIPRYGYTVVKSYPHDRAAFTEGLQYADGALYEGTGLNGKSELRRVALASGEVQQRCALPDAFFGEGVTVLGDKIYQLTWQTHVGFVYDKASLALQRSFTYPSEGWGLTTDGQRLIMSDGTATIHFLDPATLEQTGAIEVYDDRGPVVRLNELEYVRGEIYANVWQTDQIARIDPASGQVLGWIDLAGLLSPEDRRQPVDVLNGIAYDAAGDRLFVTGKLWPKLFEIRLVPAG